jgi:hypothetical protein
MAQRLETYHSNGNIQEVYAANNYPDEYYFFLKDKFPWFDRREYVAISSPVFHDILQENVISAILPYDALKYIFVPTNYLAGARKFCLSSNTSFIKQYLPLTPELIPKWLPEYCIPLSKGYNYEEYARPYPPITNNFTDYYFGGDPELVESYFNLPKIRGKYSTWYAATEMNGKVVRVKQYTYDIQGTLSDWSNAFETIMREYAQI